MVPTSLGVVSIKQGLARDKGRVSLSLLIIKYVRLPLAPPLPTLLPCASRLQEVQLPIVCQAGRPPRLHPQRPFLVSVLQGSGADDRRRTPTPLALRYSVLSESALGTNLSVLTPFPGAVRGAASPHPDGNSELTPLAQPLAGVTTDPLRLSHQLGGHRACPEHPLRSLAHACQFRVPPRLLNGMRCFPQVSSAAQTGRT